MNVLDTRAPEAVAPVRSTPTTIPRHHGVRVEIVDARRFAALRPEWLDLLARADAQNVFMDPDLVRIAAGVYPERQIGALLAWARCDGAEKLAGVLAFAVGRPRKSPVPLRVLLAPACANAYLATPVIDRAGLDQVLHAMLDAVAESAGLPKIIALDAMGMDGATLQALASVCAARGSDVLVLERFRRPMLASQRDGHCYLEQALSRSTRKKLRQHRRRLGERGTLSFATIAEPALVCRSVEQFLRLEASGWKGRTGTALLCDERDAAFARAMIAALAEQRCASVHALCLDDTPVSMQIVLRSGAAAFTWKTAYDEQFRDFSPGMLLLEDYTAAFLADRSIAMVDSCAQDENGFMSVWAERQTVADIWIDARPGASLAFRALGRLQQGYRRLRAGAKSCYLALPRSGR